MRPRAAGYFDPREERDACGVGFVARVDGTPSHGIVTDAVQALCNLEHRGAVGGDMKTGDGAGILVQIPHRFFARTVGFELPEPGSYGLGFFFLPADAGEAREARRLVDRHVQREGGEVLGWREVPVNPDCLGEQAREEMPGFAQVFVRLPAAPGEELERRLYLLRKRVERSAREWGWELERFYIPSFSSRTVVYKGMFVSTQFLSFYPDLDEEDFGSAMAVFHQRYSTNTFPSWFLAQPFRLIAHNGEINTLRRNVNNMRARERSLASELFGGQIDELRPVVNADMSDSAIFDSVLELLVRGGRGIDHSLIMMIPEAFGERYHISQDKRAFFEYHAAIMEPWDGPAAVCFCDGARVGALLDRNGLRPGRYVITRSGKVILASEVGVLEVDPEEVLEKGRLAPGKMFLVDTERKRIIKDNEIKSSVSRRQPYRHWLEKNRIQLKGLLGASRPSAIDRERVAQAQRAFGYTREELTQILAPMIENAQEPVGSMGNDSSLAVLSERPQLLFSYFKQLFAQVTNPPIDPYRENLVMSLMSFVGRERNLLAETPEHCRQLKLSHPILTNDDVEMLRASPIRDFRVCTVPILFDPHGPEGSLEQALEEVCAEVEARIDEGHSLVILSDRGISPERAAIPSLLAIGGVHHHLVRAGKRHLSGLAVETGEAREVHHFAALVGFGASGVNPYLVFESIPVLQEAGYVSRELPVQEAIDQYITAVKKGLLKVMSKMGVSTLRSYRGSQIFEAVGLSQALIDRCFAGTPSLIGGIGMAEVEQERRTVHLAAFAEAEPPAAAAAQPAAAGANGPAEGGTEGGVPAAIYTLPSGGLYSHRRGSESHLFSPEAITLLQQAVRTGSYEVFRQYTAVVNDRSRNLCTLRGLFRFVPATPVPLEEVEGEELILERFVSSAMSFGSLSPEAHETLAIAMNRLGCRSNSGEGGEDPARFGGPGSGPGGDGEDRNSKIKQVASARFGVTSEYLLSAEELQIKMAQGAKPGEGGQLPGHKVDETIARVRHSTPGVMLISPPPHHDIYSIEDLAQLIFDLRHANPRARVSVKLVSEVGVGTVAAGVAKGKADTVLISGGDGGTGASPLSSIMHTGTPWEIGLAETQAVLVGSRLRESIRVQVDGQLKTGRDVVVAALLGAEEFGFATTTLVAMGCVMMRKCHLNTCPVGVATQDPELRKRFAGRPEHVMYFMRFLARQVRELMAELGFRRFEEMIGQVDHLAVDEAVGHHKTRGLDFGRLLCKPPTAPGQALYCRCPRVNGFPPALDDEILARAAGALERREPLALEMPIRNSHRAVGASLSAEVSRRFGGPGLPPDTVRVKFHGSAGQSFGAFLAPGITFELEGDANDYLCKGLSGGKVILYPPRGSAFLPERNIITGNVALFGATAGEVYINGAAGERFCVRNSGAVAVVEGVGDHGCEYMTGGRVIVLGETGVNFAAGMSGGAAYVLDASQLFDTRCNLEMVDVEPVTEPEDREFLQRHLRRHVELTGSRHAARILELWEEMLPLFVRVIPLDYRDALRRLRERELKESESANLTEEVYV
ncbi:MAG: glutamate synthase subunit alpha [Spirochaetales bacterium]|nr:glutamate synthase subunit alpha [Spirochaetales bacterium]